eukprot:CAMPEP_0184652496 /NCGR_PEP_ID=MMETSP0308-20130426/10198_1 /TAXON_ID=38269 /ORGANISM="Gloeochaete witrockiana, Strain SAG 46.84" /LENGTH=439 /DNA_ID=CAMNT_0027087403 /DNA_START=250 /DNA_END=1569 /DNA_ORIENTATION=+
MLSSSDSKPSKKLPVTTSQIQQRCDYDLGESLIERWKEAKKTYCTPKNGSQSPSGIYCHRIYQSRHTAHDNFCYATNIYVDWNRISWGQGEHPPDDPILTEGFISADCDVDHGLFQDENFQLWYKVLMRSFRTNTERKDVPVRVDEPTILASRDSPHNQGHNMADRMSIWVSLRILGLEPEDSHFISIDSHEKGPFWVAEEHMAQKGQISARTQHADLLKEGGIVHYKHLIFAIPGGSSFIWKDGWITNECTSAPLLEQYSHSFLSYLGMVEEYPPLGRLSVPTIVLNSRSKRPDGTVVGRIMKNEDQVWDVISNVSARNGWNAIRVDMVKVGDYRQQVAFMRNTTVFIGMHGAGFVHINWMPKEGVIIELFSHGFESRMYRNEAKWRGKVYFSWHNTKGEEPYHSKESHATIVDIEAFTSLMESTERVLKAFGLGLGY